MAKKYNSGSANNKKQKVLGDTSLHGAGQKIDPAQPQLASEQTPGVMPMDVTRTKMTNTNKKVGYMMRGARKDLKKRGY